MRRVLVAAAVAGLAVFAIPAAQAAAFTGLVSPTVIGGLADLTGNGTVTAADSWTAFYGDTDIIGGGLDCNAWAATNDGAAGDGVIGAADDCMLVGFDGTANGVTITVSNGHFVEADGVLIADGYKLPTTFNAADPDNPSVVAADFGLQVIGGRVDANGDGVIDTDDCAVNIVNGWDILGNGCAFGVTVPDADFGKIDVNGDQLITAADDSTSAFFGLSVVDGLVQAAVAAPDVTAISPTSGAVGSTVTITGTNLSGATVKFGTTVATVTSNTATEIKAIVPNVALGAQTVTVTTAGGSDTIGFTVTAAPTGNCDINGTPAGDLLVGTSKGESICGVGGNDELRGKKGADLLKGGQGDDVLKGGKGNDVLKGGPGFDICKGGKGNDVLRGCEA
jgi:RTX calcium-binding nonapeptide repeat (4 copies)/IPT/TIG domain